MRPYRVNEAFSDMNLLEPTLNLVILICKETAFFGTRKLAEINHFRAIKI